MMIKLFFVKQRNCVHTNMYRSNVYVIMDGVGQMKLVPYTHVTLLLRLTPPDEFYVVLFEFQS